MMYKTMRPAELADELRNGSEIRFIDVREPIEFEIARVEGAELLPMSQFQVWAPTLDPEERIVVMCHHGVRSGNVCMALVSAGFRDVTNLHGGIDLWSAEVDGSVPRY